MDNFTQPNPLWFPHICLPFNGAGRIETIDGIVHPSNLSASFITPPYLFAELLQVRVNYLGPAMGSLNTNYPSLKVTRGDTVTFQALSQSITQVGAVNNICTFTVNMSHLAMVSSLRHFNIHLPPKMRLYPHDLVTFYFTNPADNCTVTSMAATLETWHIF
jgi:hypothetical protein